MYQLLTLRFCAEQTAALVASGLGSFPSKNWTHAEDTPRQIGLMEAYHSTWTLAYERFDALCGGKD